MIYFSMGKDLWKVELTSPNNPILYDHLGVTDPNTMTVYLSDELTDDETTKVLLHELGHCAIFSFGLYDQIHTFVKPQYWAYAEDWICNFVADWGRYIFESAYQVLGDIVWSYISNRMWVMR